MAHLHLEQAQVVGGGVVLFDIQNGTHWGGLVKGEHDGDGGAGQRIAIGIPGHGLVAEGLGGLGQGSCCHDRKHKRKELLHGGFVRHGTGTKQDGPDLPVHPLNE